LIEIDRKRQRHMGIEAKRTARDDAAGKIRRRALVGRRVDAERDADAELLIDRRMRQDDGRADAAVAVARVRLRRDAAVVVAGNAERDRDAVRRDEPARDVRAEDEDDLRRREARHRADGEPQHDDPSPPHVTWIPLGLNTRRPLR
jgi:hypothetical protein